MNRLSLIVEIAAVVAGLSLVDPAWSFEPDPPAEQQARILLADKSGGSYLGIGVVEVTAERARTLNLREERGVEITRVEDNSPAGKGGLKTGDVVLEYNGQRIEGVEQFMRMVRETPPGREVKLSVSRAGGMQQAVVKTGSRKGWTSTRLEPLEGFRWNMPEIRIPDMPRANMTWRSVTLGIEAESLDSQLAEYFGVKEGVLVRSVIKGSAAEKAGLKAGDVITKVDDTSVATPREITSAIRAERSKKTVTVAAVRDKREVTFNVTLEEVNAATPGKRISGR